MKNALSAPYRHRVLYCGAGRLTTGDVQVSGAARRHLRQALFEDADGGHVIGLKLSFAPPTKVTEMPGCFFACPLGVRCIC